jgi:hypothetical protein
LSLLIALLSACSPDVTVSSRAGQSPEPSQLVHYQIAPQFAAAGDFNEGLAAVQIGNKWGYIDRNGKQVIAPQFDGVSRFSDGLAAVQVGGKQGRMGYIDKHGNLAIDPIFLGPYWSSDFRNGVAIVIRPEDEHFGLIDKHGSYIVKPQFNWITRVYDGSYVAEMWSQPHVGSAIYNSAGKEVMATTLGIVSAPSAGLAEYRKQFPTDPAGMLALNGRIIIEPKYRYIGLYSSEGLAAFCSGTIDDAMADRLKCGYLDVHGNQFVAASFSAAGSFVDGLAAVRIGDTKSGKYGYLGPDGHFHIPPKFTFADEFSEGLARASVEENRLGYIDTAGAFALPDRYVDESAFKDGLASVVSAGPKSKLWALIDRQGRQVVPPISEEQIRPSEGLAAVKVSGKWGYVNVR